MMLFLTIVVNVEINSYHPTDVLIFVAQNMYHRNRKMAQLDGILLSDVRRHPENTHMNKIFIECQLVFTVLYKFRRDLSSS